MSKILGILESLFWNVALFFVYDNVIFKCIPGLGYFYSRVVLVGIIIICLILVKISKVKKNGFLGKYCVAIALPYGIYTVISYWSICNHLCLGLSIACGALLMIYIIYIFRETNYHRFRKLIAGLLIIMTLTSLAASSVVFTAQFTGISLPLHVVPIHKNAEETKLNDHLQQLSILVTDDFNKLTVKEKCELLQIIADIECTYLGLEALTVKAKPLKQYVLGSYDDNKKIILVNINYLETDVSGLNGGDWVQTIAHECYHSYQRELIRTYYEASNKSLMIFDNVEEMENEFTNYVSGSEDIAKYQNQIIEKDANAYGDSAWAEYETRLSRYLQGNQ